MRYRTVNVLLMKRGRPHALYAYSATPYGIREAEKFFRAQVSALRPVRRAELDHAVKKKHFHYGYFDLFLVFSSIAEVI